MPTEGDQRRRTVRAVGSLQPFADLQRIASHRVPRRTAACEGGTYFTLRNGTATLAHPDNCPIGLVCIPNGSSAWCASASPAQAGLALLGSHGSTVGQLRNPCSRHLTVTPRTDSRRREEFPVPIKSRLRRLSARVLPSLRAAPTQARPTESRYPWSRSTCNVNRESAWQRVVNVRTGETQHPSPGSAVRSRRRLIQRRSVQHCGI